MRVGLLQMPSGGDPGANPVPVRARMQEAATRGAECGRMPELTICLSASRTQRGAGLRLADEGGAVSGWRGEAARRWIFTADLDLGAVDKTRNVSGPA